MTPRFPIEDDALTEAVARALEHLANAVQPPDPTLMARHGLPLVVHQALRDRALRPVDRLAMHYLSEVLDFREFREMKAASLAATMGVEAQTAGRALRTLTEAGYLEEHGKRRPRAYRMPWSRRSTASRAA